ncbi:hypothetical protein [Pseudomonas sp. PDM26]|uniref:hypothetical protein n=1 Tax=Pseudomonas sp. PDM26 TaxID=2854766 RepID=UPI00352920F6
MITALERELGNPDSAVAMMNTVSKYGRADGLDYRFDSMLFGDTADAHVLVSRCLITALGCAALHPH